MRFLPRPLALCALLHQVVVAPAMAAPMASIHWGTCPFPVSNSPNRDATNGTAQTITVTGTGLNGPVRRVELYLVLYAGGSGVPDAWRFDPGGCQAGHLQYNFDPDPPSCPSLRGAPAPGALQFEYRTYPPGGWTQANEVLTYSALFDPIATTPSVTYTLLRLDLDLSAAVSGVTGNPSSCGCMERPVCIRLGGAAWWDAQDVAHEFLLADNGIRWNDSENQLACGFDPCELNPGPCPFPGDTLCVATTPVLQPSWGRVKAAYR